MLGVKLDGVNLSASTADKRHFKEILQFLLCCFASLPLLAAAGRPAKADDDPNSLKVHATAYLRIALNTRASATSGENIIAEFNLFKNTQKQLLLNPVVLRAALKQAGIGELAAVKNQNHPIEWLHRNLQVTFPGDAQIMQVSLSGASQKELALLLNAVIDAYMKEIVEADRTRTQERLIELKKIQIEKAQELKDALSELRRMAESLGTSETEVLNQKQKNQLDELVVIRTEVLRSMFEQNRMVGELKAKQAERDALENQPITDIEVQLTFQSDPTVKELGKRLAKVDHFVNTVPSNDKPQGEQIKNQVAEIQEKYNKRMDQLRQELANKKRAEADRDIKKLEAVIAVSQKQLDASMEDLKLLRKSIDKIGFAPIDMQIRRRAIASLQKSLDTINDEFERLKIESLASPRVTVLDKAEVPE